MKPFAFPLQAVLEQREREERDRRIGLARFERLRNEIEARIRSHQASIVQAKRDVSAQAMSPTEGGTMLVDMRALKLQTNTALHLRAKAQMLVVRLADLQKELERARADLATARARRRAVELLKEKAYEAWKKERARREAAELDDINSVRAARKAMARRIGA